MLRGEDFDYDLPAEAIAQAAIEPRDSSRLLVASTLEDLRFWELTRLLDAGDLLVVNETRVRAARLEAAKPTGGVTEVLLTSRLSHDRWEAMVRPARRIHAGTRLCAGPLALTVLTEPDRGVVEVDVTAPGDVDDLLPTYGAIPLPPYFHGALDDEERYQTIFAKTVGSAAAPTAALHFTPELVEAMTDKGVELAAVELEVGVDTFRPMEPGAIADHHMHSERYRISDEAADAIVATRSRGGRIIAVGTTVVRTLESSADGNGGVRPGSGETDLFIAPGHRFSVVDAMVTNFHAPRTTLLVMIAATVGDRWRVVYEHALASGYRFLSFGDAMFITVAR
jgi:S-adenosylmethionine:tRNA ribosyltransferase-isomerase